MISEKCCVPEGACARLASFPGAPISAEIAASDLIVALDESLVDGIEPPDAVRATDVSA